MYFVNIHRPPPQYSVLFPFPILPNPIFSLAINFPPKGEEIFLQSCLGAIVHCGIMETSLQVFHK